MTKDEYIKQVDAARVKMTPTYSIPKCCVTCEYLARDGQCEQFDMYPPLAYLTQINDCEEYLQEVPF